MATRVKHQLDNLVNFYFSLPNSNFKMAPSENMAKNFNCYCLLLTVSSNKPVKDIEDAIQNVEMKKRKMEVALDKTRGFVKYGREKRMWRDAAKRQGDWNEIYDYKHIRSGDFQDSIK